MERTDLFDLMSELKLYGMRLAYDEVMATGIKRQHEPPQIVGDLLKAEIAEKQARSIKTQAVPSFRKYIWIHFQILTQNHDGTISTLVL